MPRSKKRGKPRRSCDFCARMKFACQGSLPCSSCQTNSLVCTYNRLQIHPSSSGTGSQRDGEDAGNPIVSSASQPPTNDPLKLVAAGKIDMALSYQPEVLVARGENIPVRSFAAIVRHPLNHLMFPADSSIHSPKDFPPNKRNKASKQLVLIQIK